VFHIHIIFEIPGNHIPSSFSSSFFLGGGGMGGVVKVVSIHTIQAPLSKEKKGKKDKKKKKSLNVDL
jgi:hypothetical protein